MMKPFLDVEPFVSRRRVLATAGAGVAVSCLSPLAEASATRKRVLRVAHLTDVHVQPEQGAPEGLAMALEHAQSGKNRADLILTGGDMIMDALDSDRDRVQAQWDVFHRVLRQNLRTPIHHAVGNHDVWGWEAKAKYASEPKFGKAWACEALELERPYYSFDKGGWHFIMLDSIQTGEGDGYTGRLDDPQFEWLQGDLASTPAKTPVMVVSHIPIIAACAYFDGQNERTGTWMVPAALMHSDARRIKDLFRKHPNVKLCVSGHEHLLDEVVYNGVTYACNGAVCGSWWNGDYQECTYGYAQIDLFDDGSFTNRYVPYGWKTRE